MVLSAWQVEGQIMSSNGQPRTENHGLGHRHGGQGEKSVWSNPEHAPHERGRAHHPHYGDGPHGSPAKSGDAPMAGVPAAGKPRAVPCTAGLGAAERACWLRQGAARRVKARPRWHLMWLAWVV